MKWAAIGDSYASGVAAGNRLPGANSRQCSRFDGSYPVVLNNDPALGDNPSRQFQDFACSGSTIADVLNKQVPQLDTDEDMVTLTVGGNNVGFADLVDACIYQFRPRPADCQTQIQATWDIINGQQLSADLDSLLQAILSRVSISGPTFRLYVTGYAAFWNDVTTQCNGVSWSYWNQRQNRMYLTTELRAQFNDLAISLNGVINAAVLRANANDPGDNSQGSRVIYVDYDAQYEGHRFCEEGVVEPDPANPNTWFFQKDTPLEGSSDTPTDYPEDPNFYDEVSQWVNQTQAEHPDWTAASPVAGPRLPLSIEKIFHPTKPGHLAIEQQILGVINSVFL
jgi:hypothetical protein